MSASAERAAPGAAWPILQIDAFTDRPFAGNPAGVMLLPEARDAEWMQLVAREMNLAETAFLVRRGDGDGWDLRWFTPAVEVDLCGHATLASAHALWTEHGAAEDALRFHTRSGVLTCRRGGPGIEMDFPAEPVVATPAPEHLLEGLGLADGPYFVGRNRMDWLVEVADDVAVRALTPDFGRLARVAMRGVIVTSLAGPGDVGVDFVSRWFGPPAGVDEDPVTGSAHCALAPYWSARLGRPALVGYQASARGGTVHVRVAGDRVVLGGSAVTVLRGELLA
jgi:PhzF family phenazine biosynthesis protein